MKRLLILFLTILAVVSCNKEPAVDSIENISMSQFDKAYNPSQDILLDVRTNKEYQEGYIKDATLADVKQRDAFIDKVETLDKNKTIYVYCRSGKRSLKASKILKEQGFKDIKNIKGGIKVWEGELNYP